MSILDSPQTTQLQLRPGIIELNWGQPDPELLPKEAVSSAAAAVLARMGGDALSYGAAAGAGPLLAWLRAHIARTEQPAVTADEIAITAGNSDAIDQVCTLFTQAGDVVLVESPSYHLALRIMRDHPLRLVPVAARWMVSRPKCRFRRSSVFISSASRTRVVLVSNKLCC